MNNHETGFEIFRKLDFLEMARSKDFTTDRFMLTRFFRQSDLETGDQIGKYDRRGYLQYFCMYNGRIRLSCEN